MTDLISRQALKNSLTNWQMEYAEKGKDVERFETLGAVIELVEQLPTIDAVPVVRCKDCKWYRKEYGWNCIEFKVCGISPTHHPIMNEDEFCSRAKRSEDETD